MPQEVDWHEGMEEPPHSDERPRRKKKRKPMPRDRDDGIPIRGTVGAARRRYSGPPAVAAVIGWAPWAGLVLWLVAVVMTREMVKLREPNPFFALANLAFGLTGVFAILGSLIHGALTWAKMGGTAGVENFRVGTIGAILALILAPLLATVWGIFAHYVVP